MTKSGVPHIIASDGTATPLARITFTERGGQGTFDENHLQEVLFRHPGLLPCAEIDPAYAELIPVCRELQTLSGYIDLVCMTPEGKLAIIETKLWRNPQARREVVAQILDYAKDLVRWSYSDLEREVKKVSGQDRRSLFERVAGSSSEQDEIAFCDQVARQLRTGQFLLLIVGDGIREGVGDLTEFLDEFGSMQFSFGLVEVRVHQLPDGARLLAASLVARTALLRRTVVVLQGEHGPVAGEAPEEDSREDDPQEPDPERLRQEALRLAFWERLLQQLQFDDASQPMARPTHSTNLYFNLPPSGSEAWLAAFLKKSAGSAGVYLKLAANSPFSEAAWQSLLQDQVRIHEELGFQADWDEARKAIADRRALGDLEATAHQDELLAFFADRLNRFVNVFRPRLERVVQQFEA